MIAAVDTSTIDALIQSHPVILFMKGTQAAPQCGFSSRTVDILLEYDTPLADVNIIEREDLREAMKIYSSWPTFPQLYVQGAFIGGADIVEEMHASGELETLLGKKKHVAPPNVQLTPAALTALMQFGEDQIRAGTLPLRIEMGGNSGTYEPELELESARPKDVSLLLKTDTIDVALSFPKTTCLKLQPTQCIHIDFDAAHGAFRVRVQ